MTTVMGLKTKVILTVMAVASFAATGVAMAQDTNAKLHGHVNNAAGATIKTGDVKLTTDKTGDAKDKVYKFSFPLDQDGNYKGSGITPGDYVVVVMVDKKIVDYQNITLRAGDDKPLDFDMTRAEYIKAMSPEDRAALEEFKKKNAAISADNAKIANINKTLLQARDDEKNGKADVAVTELQPLTEAKPNEPVIWGALGEAQAAAADAAAKTAKNDPATLKMYQDAADSYKKAIDLMAPPAKPNPVNLGTYYLNMGRSLAKVGKLPEAGEAYEMSAKTNPAMAAQAYYNEAVSYYSASKMTEAADAAGKAITADPKKAEAYYIKAQALIPGATVDKAGKIVTPPGCVESYQMYLELAPDGPYAADVKGILAGLGEPIKNSFKAPGKK